MKSKNGLKFLQIIVIVLFASAFFMPDHSNRTLVLAIAVIGIIGALLLFLIPLLPRLPKIQKSRRKKKMPKTAAYQPSDMENLLLRQISYQITAKLQSAYPKATWDFIRQPDINRLISGEPMRIRTKNTNDFNFAEVRMDSYGSLMLSMMTIETLKRRPSDESPEDNPAQVDPESWYTLIGKPLLVNLVGDLQARGHQKLFINEQGQIYIENGNTPEIKGTFEYFPPRNYWAALTDILIRDELEATETEQALEISWV